MGDVVHLAKGKNEARILLIVERFTIREWDLSPGKYDFTTRARMCRRWSRTDPGGGSKDPGWNMRIGTDKSASRSNPVGDFLVARGLQF